MKNVLRIIFFILFCNLASAADKYEGTGELKLGDPDINIFMDYIKPPAGQVPMAFLVLSENGKAIWSTYWYCPEGNCQTLNKSKASIMCTQDAEKFYERTITEECKIFARRRTIVWKNGINIGKGKVSRVKSRWKKNEVTAKLEELGFLGNSTSSIDTTKPKITKKKKENKKSDDIVSQINSLKKLLDDGVISKEEFKKAKKKILN